MSLCEAVCWPEDDINSPGHMTGVALLRGSWERTVLGRVLAREHVITSTYRRMTVFMCSTVWVDGWLHREKSLSLAPTDL